MGLQEKRKAKQLQDDAVPALLAELKSMSGGSNFEIYVNWQNFLQEIKTLENLEGVGFSHVRKIFESVCADDIGKQCVRERLKRIDFKQFVDPSEKQVEFFDGVLVISGDWASATTDGWPKLEELQTAFEKGL
jgi:hypothetical protein